MPAAPHDVQPVDRLPRNFARFIDEIAAALETLYGEAGAREYRRNAMRWGARVIALPGTAAWVTLAPDTGEAAGLLMTRRAGALGQVTFVHVLAPWTGRGCEHALVAAGVDALERDGASRITAECLPLGPLDLDPPFAARGFHALPRLFMSRTLTGWEPPAAPASDPATPAIWPDAARVLAAAYAQHEDAALLEDVREEQAARRFLASMAAGAHGQSRPGYLRVVRREGAVAGVAAGCRLAEGVGFVMQVAVAPVWQNQGLGGTLMRDLMAAFQADGLARVALGVTATNPARRLYERLGFETARDVTAYYRDR
jgi:ribosomal protein S18 acetylase RimI-like enzyme